MDKNNVHSYTLVFSSFFFQILHEYSALENFWKRYNKVNRVMMQNWWWLTVLVLLMLFKVMEVSDSTFTLQVLLDKLALDKEKHTLLQENQQLRAVLKQYLDGMFLSFIYILLASCLFFLSFVSPFPSSFPHSFPFIPSTVPLFFPHGSFLEFSPV